MTREEGEAYRARWRLAEGIGRQEARRESFKRRWDVLNAIFDLGYELGWVKPHDDDQVAQIRERSR